MDELLKDFLSESSEHIEGAETKLLEFEKDPTNASLVASIFRLVHTIKGTAGFLGLERLQTVAHAAETVLGELRDGASPDAATISSILTAIDRIKWILGELGQIGEEPGGSDDDVITPLQQRPGKAAPSHQAAVTQASPVAPAASAPAEPVKEAAGADRKQEPGPAKTEQGQANGETIRVAVGTIESIMQLVSELVLTRNQLVELTRRSDNESIKAPLQRLSSLTTDLQDSVMRARMQPVGRLYTSLPRLIRELSAEVGKKIVLRTDGADTEIDRQLIDVIRDPLTHLIRNCADHGIESPEERLAAGKPEFGEISVSASHQAGHITITIGDDGRGLDVQKISAKIVAKGLASAAAVEAMSRDDLYRYIFEPGFSTAQSVTNVSGRGVGMDVVRSNVESIGGNVLIRSSPGRGTVFTLKIPLTLAIAPALIIEAGGQRFALPQHSVAEVVGIGPQSIHQLDLVQNALVLKIREEVLPAVELGEVLNLKTEKAEDRLAVIVRLGSAPLALIVDKVIDVQEIVVKPLSATLAHLRVFSGRTILGDGSVVLILDAAGIASRIGIESGNEKKREVKRKESDANDRMRLILFKAGAGVLKALPLSVVSRIETVQPEQIRVLDGRLAILRQSSLMPVIPVSQAVETHAGCAKPLLVVGRGSAMIGLLVDEIVDIVEERIVVQLKAPSRECIGAAEIRGDAIEILDVSHFLVDSGDGASRAGTRTGRFLIVGDSPAFSDTYITILGAAGHQAVVLKSKSDLEQIDEHAQTRDAIVVDLDMNAEARSAWLANLKHVATGSCPIIGLCTNVNEEIDDAEDISRVSKADRHELLAVLAAHLRSRTKRSVTTDSHRINGVAA